MRIKPYLNFSLLSICALLLTACNGTGTGVLNPKGIIAAQEKALLFDTSALMLIVVIPVIIMSIAFVIRYRQAHKVSDYKPNWSHSYLLEALWWGVPMVIILIMSIMTWIMTHKLDPYKRIKPTGKPLVVEAVALPWKWLFIYPEQNIATVNKLELPVNREVKFYLTSDNVPMSAFFVPQLGSQIYTMAGMQTKLHLVANEKGTYEGLDSQYNGHGFSDMHFKVDVVDDNALEQWFQSVKNKPTSLDAEQYKTVRQFEAAAPVSYFSGVQSGLFKQIIRSYHKKEHP